MLAQLDLLAWRPTVRAPRKRKRIRRPKKITRAAYIAPTRTATQVVYHSTVVVRPAVYPDGWLDTKSPRRSVGPLDELETLEEMHATRYASWRGDRGDGIGALGGVTRGARNVCEHGHFHARDGARPSKMVPRGVRRG